MAKDPAALFYYKDILVSCSGWDADERGWYCWLLFHQADKPNGLPIDLEELASLADVKYSQFERFKACWEARLKGCFKQIGQRLFNERMAEVVEERRGYKEGQSHRGIVGVYVKRFKRENNATYEQVKAFIQIFSQENLREFSLKEREGAYKRTVEALLQALLVNADADGNVIGEENEIQGVQGDQPESILGKVEELHSHFSSMDQWIEISMMSLLMQPKDKQKFLDSLKEFLIELGSKHDLDKGNKAISAHFISWYKKNKITNGKQSYGKKITEPRTLEGVAKHIARNNEQL